MKSTLILNVTLFSHDISCSVKPSDNSPFWIIRLLLNKTCQFYSFFYFWFLLTFLKKNKCYSFSWNFHYDILHCFDIITAITEDTNTIFFMHRRTKPSNKKFRNEKAISYFWVLVLAGDFNLDETDLILF